MAILTDDTRVQAKINARMSDWESKGSRIDKEFLQRMMSLPRIKRNGRFAAKRKMTGRDEYRYWVIGTQYRDFTEKERRFIDRDEPKAEERKAKYGVRSNSRFQEIVWPHDKSRFFKESVVGDFVIDITGREVSPVQVILTKSLHEGEGYFILAPFRGLRKKTLAEFKKRLGIPRSNRTYKDTCAKLLKRECVNRLGRLWKGLDT